MRVKISCSRLECIAGPRGPRTFQPPSCRREPVSSNGASGWMYRSHTKAALECHPREVISRRSRVDPRRGRTAGSRRPWIAPCQRYRGKLHVDRRRLRCGALNSGSREGHRSFSNAFKVTCARANRRGLDVCGSTTSTKVWAVVKVVELPCGGPQAAVSYTAAKGRIARIPQVVRYSNNFSPGAARVPRGILPL